MSAWLCVAVRDCLNLGMINESLGPLLSIMATATFTQNILLR